MSEDPLTPVEAIARLRAWVDEVGASKPQHGRRLIEWARARAGFLDEASGNEAVVEARQFVERCRRQQPQAATFDVLYDIADFLLLAAMAKRSGAASMVGAIDQAIGLRTALKPGSGSYATVAVAEARLRMQLFVEGGEILELEVVIELTDQVVSTPLDRVLRADRLDAFLLLSEAARTRGESMGFGADMRLALQAALGGYEAAETQEVKGLFIALYSTALRSCIDGGDAGVSGIDEAIAAAQSLLSGINDTGLARAELLDRVGNLHDSRYRLRHDAADLDTAISLSREALALVSDESLNVVDKTRLRINLCLSLLQCASLRRDAEVLREALHICESGLATEGLGAKGVGSLEGLRSQALLMLNVLEPSAKHLDEAIDAASRTCHLAWQERYEEPPQYLMATGAKAAPHVARLVGALLQRGAPVDVERALAVGEAAKSPLLLRSLNQHSLPSDGLPKSLLDRERALLGKLVALDSVDLERGTVQEDRLERIERMYKRKEVLEGLRQLWSEMALLGAGGARYVALRVTPEASLRRQLDELEPNTLALSMIETLRVTKDLTWEVEVAHLCFQETEPRVRLLGRLCRSKVETVKRALASEVLSGSATPANEETWHIPLLDLLGPPLKPTQYLLLSPARGLESVPWLVAFERAGWLSSTNASGLAVVPSLAAASAPTEVPDSDLLTRTVYAVDAEDQLRMFLLEANPLGWPALVVANPTCDLPYAEAEGKEVAEYLGVKPLTGLDCTRSVVEAGLASAEVIHLAAHIKFNAADPLDSRVFLADGVMRARDLMRLSSAAKIVVLSCCEGGAGDSLGGEVLGLVAALLRSGVTTVLASLWRVDDRATFHLMDLVYQRLRNGLPVTQALFRSMVDLRRQSPFDRTWHWGAFQVFSREADARIQLPVRGPMTSVT
jgi:hypothetical protein